MTEPTQSAFQEVAPRFAKDVLILAVIMLLTLIIIPIYALYAAGGATDERNLSVFTYAAIIGLGSFLLYILPTKLGRKIPRVKYFEGYVHDPERGLINLPKLKATTLFKVSVIGVLFFGIFSVTTNTFFIAIPQFQAGGSSQLALSMEPASGAETLFLQGAILPMITGALVVFAFKNSKTLILALLLAVILTAIFATGIHLLRYGESQTNLLSVFVFFTIANILTVLTGSIIPAWTFHSLSNGFFALKNCNPAAGTALCVSPDAITLGTMILIVFFSILTIAQFARRKT